MKKFDIGDKVIALTDPLNPGSQPRIKGKIYKVESILYCSYCGEQMINIGETSTSTILHHSKCGNKQENKGLHWTSSDHFSKIDDFDESLQEAIESENYELACLLRDLKSILKDYAKS